MDQAELDNSLEELEIRMERLRALYEQYFMGIEKIEPTVPRKDVDRRVWLLRKEQIRNTGRRFKLNVLIQRYNTFQQYWMRICREIENGTYSRHLARMRRSGQEQDQELLTIAARRRAGHFAGGRGEGEAQEPEPDSMAASLDPLDELRQAMDESFDAPPGPGSDTDVDSLLPGPGAIPQAPRIPSPGLTPFDLDLDDGTLPTRGGPRPPDPPARSPSTVPPGLHAPSVPPPPPRPAAAAPARPLPPPQSRLSQGQPVDPAVAPPPPRPALRVPPPPPTAPHPAAPAASAQPAQPAPGSTLTPQRIKELHARLAEAKRSTNEGGNVSEEALLRSLRAAEAKLKAQHGAQRRVDFEVVVKDGKAVLKPVVR